MEFLIYFGEIILAAVLGAFIGIERESIHKEAGMRTCAIVTMGATLFTIVSQHSVLNTSLDPTRIAAQVVTGIGFLGAGLIIFHKEKLTGLTTAAALWLSAAIGLAIGFDLYWLAIFVTLVTLVILHFLPQLDGTPDCAKKNNKK